MNSPISTITNEDLFNRLDSPAVPAIVDVRSSMEFRRGHIPGALHIPFWKMFSKAKTVSARQDRDVIVYCEHGPRAVVGRFALHNAGFAKVYYLKGHMAGWRKKGLPMEYNAVHGQ